MKYFINDFTEDNYKYLLQLAKVEKQFITYNEALEGKKGIILRHDVDISVHRAFVLAQIEKNESVKATYFIHLHSVFYSAFEKEIEILIRKIVKCGHFVGLHFEPAYYNLKETDIEEMEKYIDEEKNILEGIVENEVNYISYHNPDIGGNWCSLDSDRIGGLINAYGKTIKNKFKYCSDSNGYWRYDRLEDVLKNEEYEYLHVLLHPVWWQKEPMYPYERIERSVNGRKDKILHDYVQLLNRIGRENVKGKE